MTTKPRKQKLCTSPLEIGRSYLDIWGRWHTIQGYVADGHQWPGREKPVDKNRVYCSSCHYDIKTGECGDSTCRLVNLPPAKELAFWKKRISEIEDSNPQDKLKLIKDELQNMHDRVAALTKGGTKESKP